MALYKNNDFDVERFNSIIDAAAEGMSEEDFEKNFAPVDEDDWNIYHWAANGDKLDLVDRNSDDDMPLFMRSDLIREFSEQLTDEEEEKLGVSFPERHEKKKRDLEFEKMLEEDDDDIERLIESLEKQVEDERRLFEKAIQIKPRENRDLDFEAMMDEEGFDADRMIASFQKKNKKEKTIAQLLEDDDSVSPISIAAVMKKHPKERDLEFEAMMEEEGFEKGFPFLMDEPQDEESQMERMTMDMANRLVKGLIDELDAEDNAKKGK
ncbi:MAG: hypothetical protein IKV41_03075 [Oscillospiraceae bacterium]|nr:hypothetical protein [Oscillospiraceae bacterium]